SSPSSAPRSSSSSSAPWPSITWSPECGVLTHDERARHLLLRLQLALLLPGRGADQRAVRRGRGGAARMAADLLRPSAEGDRAQPLVLRGGPKLRLRRDPAARRRAGAAQ